MTTAELRIPRDIQAELWPYITQAEEWAGYLLCGVIARPGGWVLLGREWVPIPERYRIRGTGHGMTWHPDFDVEMLNRSQREGLGCVVVHHHYGPEPGLSGTDRRTCESLMPFLSAQSSSRPHAFVVMGDQAAAGPVYHHGAPIGELTQTRVAGSWLEVWPAKSDSPDRHHEPDPRHDRLIRGFGAKALERLRGARVGVVGVGGGGSHVVQQLAYLGVGTFVLIDADRVELSNLNRLVGALPSRSRRSILDRVLRRGRGDVGRLKVDVMRRLIREISPEAAVEVIAEAFPAQATLDVLRYCDVIVDCVDRLQVRDDLNRFCKRYLIPLIDIGLEIVPGEPDERRSTVAAIPGRITKVQPDGPCLRCQGIIDDAKLARERGGRPPGYAGDPRLPDPAVVTLNGTIASMAATEVLQILTGFAGAESPNCGWLYDGLTGCTEQVKKVFRGCDACRPERAAGDA